MRTQGDDIAEILALLGCRPVWDDASRRVTGFEVVPPGGARPPAHRRHGPHLRLLPGRVPARRRADRRRGAGGGRAGRAGRPELRAGARRRGHRRARRPAARHGPYLRLQAGGVRGGAAAADRRPQLAPRRRPRRGVRGVGRLRLRARARRAGGARGHGDGVPADRRGREERGHPRARPRRRRRLLPVPRRHGRHGAAPDGRQPRGVRRRLRHPGPGEDPDAGRGDPPGLPRPRGQPALDGGDAAARLQGRLRDGGDRRLPLRLRRHGRASWTTGCTRSSAPSTSSTRRTGSS